MSKIDEVRDYELFIGPNHPGIAGNYSLKMKLQGDKVLSAKTDAG